MSLINPESLGIASSLRFIENNVSTLGGYIGGYSAPLPTPPFSAIYAFGDSLSDAGNDYLAAGIPVSPHYYQGHFSNGPTWVEDLSQMLGLGQLAPSLAGTPNATDYAFGHAATGTTLLHSVTAGDLYAANDPTHTTQLSMYQAAHPTPQPNALYTLTIGSIDVFDAISAFPASPLKALAAIGQAVLNVDHFVEKIAADGGKNFLVLTVPDVGKTPAYLAEGPAASHLASALAAVFDAELTTSLRFIALHDGLRMDILDTYSLLDKGIANPSAFGLTNVTDPVWTGNYTDPNSGTLRTTDPVQQNHYLFWDQVHPTAAGHMILADAAAASLTHVA